MPATDQRVTDKHIVSACKDKLVTWGEDGRLVVAKMNAHGVSTHGLGQHLGPDGTYTGTSLSISDDSEVVATALLQEMGARPNEVRLALSEASSLIAEMRNVEEHTLVLEAGASSLMNVLGLNRDQDQGIDLRHSL